MRRLLLLASLLLIGSSALAQQYTTDGSLKTSVTAFPDNEPFSLNQIVGAAPSATNPLPARLTDGATFIVPALDTTLTSRFPLGTTPADNEANGVTITRNGSFMFVFDGATWDRWTGAVTGTVTANAGSGIFTTELPAAAALADNVANPTVPAVGAYMVGWNQINSDWDRVTVSRDNADGLAQHGSGILVTQARLMVFNGVTTDRVRGDATNGVDVDVTRLPDEGQQTMANSVSVAIASDQSALTVQGNKSNNGGAPGTTNVGALPAVANAAAPTQTEGNQVALRVQLDGDLVTVMEDELPAGTQNIGDVDIVTFPDNEPFNLAQVGGSAVQTGSGTATGAQRVELANNGTGQIATVTTVTNLSNLPNEGQQTAANSISVTPDTDNDAIGAAGAAPPGEYVAVAGVTSGATGGFLGGIPVCTEFFAVDIVTATTTLAITGVTGRHVYICSVNLVTAAANNVAIVAGTGATCATSTAGLNGGVTAAEGWNFAANGGIAQGSGIGAIMSTLASGGATGDSVCIITSAATQLSGTIGYAIY